MSYAPTSLGYTLVINTPVGSQKIEIPLKQLAAKATDEALAVAWPKVEAKVMSALPKVLDAAAQRVKFEVPALVDTAVNRFKPKLHEEEQKLSKQIDVKAAQVLDEATTRAIVVAGALSVVVIGSAWWIRSGR